MNNYLLPNRTSRCPMQRVLGLIFSLAGGIAILWAAFNILGGNSATMVTINDDITISAYTGGLIGAAMFTLGLLWLRD
jgi:hypothetical protein